MTYQKSWTITPHATLFDRMSNITVVAGKTGTPLHKGGSRFCFFQTKTKAA